MLVEPGKTYGIETADVDGDASSATIDTMDVFAPAFATSAPDANVDCTSSAARRPPAVATAASGARCIIRTALPGETQHTKWPLYVVVTRTDTAGSPPSELKIRARESTIYGRCITGPYDFHIEAQNATADPMCVEIAQYPASGLNWFFTWMGAAASAQLTVPAFGAAKHVVTHGTLVGGESEGALRIGACGSALDFVPSGLHVSTYAVDPSSGRYVHFFMSTANEGRTRSSW